MKGWPITKYGVIQVKKYLSIAAIILVTVFFIGNIITTFLVKEVKVDPNSYIMNDGFVMFTNADKYLELIKQYPHDFGTKVKTYKMRRGESFWSVAVRNQISIDTIIAANPFIDSLLPKDENEIVIPGEDGVLFAFDSIFELWKMNKKLRNAKSIRGEYMHSIFRALSPDDIRFAFFKDSKPEIVNASLQNLYKMRKKFQTPVNGYYTSMYGNRVDPILGRRSFHNGIDIKANRGTPIFTAREGMVSDARWHKALGHSVTILHPGGYQTLYGHMASIFVQKGEYVSTNDTIGTVGSTGRSTGPHLHFTVKRHGKAIDPLLFIW